MQSMQDAFNHPVSGPLLAPAIERVMGVPGRVIRVLYDHAELERAQRMSYDALAQEALDAKSGN
jgi:hypothetical protein